MVEIALFQHLLGLLHHLEWYCEQLHELDERQADYIREGPGSTKLFEDLDVVFVPDFFQRHLVKINIVLDQRGGFYELDRWNHVPPLHGGLDLARAQVCHFNWSGKEL